MGYQLDFAAILTGEHLRWLAQGIATTVQLSIGAWLLAFSLAVVLATLRMSGFKAAEAFVAAYVEYHQNVPLLVQVLFWYFAVPELLPETVRLWVNERNSEFILALVAIGLCFAASMSEALRSGMRALPRTQYEASRALGFGYLGTMRYVMIPQAARVALPPLVNTSLLLFKNTSIALAIGVHELTYQTRQIESDTFRTFEAFTVATLLYLAISLLIMAVGATVERRSSLR